MPYWEHNITTDGDWEIKIGLWFSFCKSGTWGAWRRDKKLFYLTFIEFQKWEDIQVEMTSNKLKIWV